MCLLSIFLSRQKLITIDYESADKRNFLCKIKCRTHLSITPWYRYHGTSVCATELTARAKKKRRQQSRWKYTPRFGRKLPGKSYWRFRSMCFKLQSSLAPDVQRQTGDIDARWQRRCSSRSSRPETSWIRAPPPFVSGWPRTRGM